MWHVKAIIGVVWIGMAGSAWGQAMPQQILDLMARQQEICTAGGCVDSMPLGLDNQMPVSEDTESRVDRASETLPGSSRDLVRAKMVCNKHMNRHADFSYESGWRPECEEVDDMVSLAYVAYKAKQDAADRALIKKALGQ